MEEKKRKATNEVDSNGTSTTESTGEYEYEPIQLPVFDLSTTKKLITATVK